MTTVIEKETGYRAGGRVCSQEEAEASFERRRSPNACILPPGTFIGYYGDDFGPDAWFVGLYKDKVVEPSEEKPDMAKSVMAGLLMILFIAVIAGVSAMLEQ